MSGYGRYPTAPPGSFPPPPVPPTGFPSRPGAGTPGTGGFAAQPPGAYGAPPAAGPPQGQSNVSFQKPGPSAYGGSGAYNAPPPQQPPAGGTYGAPPPPPGAAMPSAATTAVISGMSRMSLGSTTYGAPPGPPAPPPAQPHGQLAPLAPPSPFYQAPPSQARIQRFTAGASGPPPVGGHDPFSGSHAAQPPAAPPGGQYGYPQPPQPLAFEQQQQQQPQPSPIMGGQFHPGGPRPLATQPSAPVPSSTPSAAPTTPAAAAPGTSAQTFMEESVDWSIQCPSEMLQFTATNIPQSAQLSASSKVVLGGILRPLAPMPTELPTVSPGPAGIVRCKKCRAYINAFVSWYENGRRWRCNICGQANDCPSAYFCHLDPTTNARRDKYERPELCSSVVEYLAPSEYMVRPPQPPAYFFVLDVSAQAVASGMLAHVASAIKAALDDEEGFPGGERTQIGFLTYDTSVQYFNLSKRGRKEGNSSAAQPQMLVVADLNELFVPLPPEDLLVNLKEHRDSVDAFLEVLPTMFVPPSSESSGGSRLQNESCLGPALKAAFTILKPIGGKMLLFNSALPTLPIDGQLKPREANPRILGTDAETPLLRAQSSWYKDTAVELSRAQISVDLFLTNYNYVDVATMSDLSKYTAGNLYTFTNFSSSIDGPRMEGEIFHTLTRPTALEAVVRVRCTRGLRINNYYGNFYIRGSDLLALPNCTTESVFGFTITHEDPIIPSNVLTVQSALLYTSTNGERRIRVLTTVLPVVSDLKSVTQSIHADVYCNLLTKQGVDYALKNGVAAARGRLVQSCVELIKSARSAGSRAGMARMPGAPAAPGPEDDGGKDKGIPSHLELMPLMIMGMVKNTTFRGGTDVHPDERCASMQITSNLWVDERGKAYLYPRMFRVDTMESNAGLPYEGDESDDNAVRDEAHHMHTKICAGDESGKIRLPSMMNLTVERLSSDGIFCLENGQDAFLWVGRQTNPSLVQDIFGVDSLEGVEYSKIILHTSESDIASRLHAILTALQADTHGAPRVYVIREAQDEYLERKFLWHLVEDRAQFEHGTYTYEEFMQWIHRSTSSSTSSAPSFGSVPPAPGHRMAGVPPAPGNVGMMNPPGAPLAPAAMQMGGPPVPQKQFSQHPQMSSAPPPPRMEGPMRGPPAPSSGGFPPPPGRYVAPPPGGPTPSGFSRGIPPPAAYMASPPPPSSSSAPSSFGAPRGPPGPPPMPQGAPAYNPGGPTSGPVGMRMPPPPPPPGM